MDLNSSLVRALSDGTNTYVYGVGMIAQTHGTTAEYFLGDALGSVRQLTDNNGAITYARAYDPYGAALQAYGSAQTPYGYTGEYAANDMVYLRSRFYAPGMGRFFTRDSFPGYLDRPQSQNPYAYAWNNPVLYTDPSGETPVAVIGAIVGAFAGAGASVMMQLHNSNGNWSCVDWGQVAVWAGAGAVAGLVIGFTLPFILATPDAFVDLASMGVDLYMGDARGFALDALSLAIPGFTGAGALSHADEIYDALHVASNFDNYYDAVHFTNSVDNLYDTTHYGSGIAQSLPPACFNSFSADTEVSTKDGDTPISLIEIGDYVLAWDETTDTLGWYKVTDTIHHTDEVVIHLSIDGEELETTPEHPFYVEGEGWVNAEDLQVGDDVRNADNTTGEVEAIETEATSQEMYNLTVDEAHTFFVGDGQWLVHNINCLVVGEGSFEYSWALHRKEPYLNIAATSYESFYDLERMGFSLPSPERGFGMLDNVDARILGNYFPTNSFDTVIFNNPHILVPGNSTQTGILTAGLIDDFLESAPVILRSQGEIHINVTSSLLKEHLPVVEALSGYSMRNTFGNSQYYAPYMARYTNGKSFPYWSPERSGSLLNYIFTP